MDALQKEELTTADEQFEFPFPTGENELSAKRDTRSLKIWSVGGGKGGVGKTLLAANLSIALAQRKFSVIVIDLDLGAANMHTCLGEPYNESLPTLTDFFEQKVKQFSDIVCPTNIPNLSMISGACDTLHVANITHDQKQSFLAQIKNLKADYVILDLGAGTSFNTLDFFLAGDVGILTILPEPTSIENTYRFIKSAFFRKLNTVARDENSNKIINELKDRVDSQGKLNIATPAGFLVELERQYPELGGEVREAITDFNIKFAINQARTQMDGELGIGIRNVCRKYFGIHMDYLGYLEYDSAVWQSVRSRRPLALAFPSSPLLPKIQGFIDTLLEEEKEQAYRKY